MAMNMDQLKAFITQEVKRHKNKSIKVGYPEGATKATKRSKKEKNLSLPKKRRIGKPKSGDDIKNRSRGAAKGDIVKNGIPLTKIALYNNGTDGKPGLRPYLSITNAENKAKWEKTLYSLISSGVSVEQAMAMVGELMVADVKKTIKNWPNDLKPATVKRKGSEKALVEDGDLFGRVAYEVSDG